MYVPFKIVHISVNSVFLKSTPCRAKGGLRASSGPLKNLTCIFRKRGRLIAQNWTNTPLPLERRHQLQLAISIETDYFQNTTIEKISGSGFNK